MNSGLEVSSYDLLLTYLSELGSGEWTRFRAAIQGISNNDSDDDQAYFVKADFEALGHIEFWPEENLWSVAPAALVQIPSEIGAQAILAGSRFASLMTKLRDNECICTSQLRAPNRILVNRASVSDLMRLAEDLNVTWSPNFSERLAKVVPSTSLLFESAEDSPAPSGWSIQKFEDLRWVDTSNDRGNGFYRYRYFTTEYRLKWEDRCRKLDRSTGIYEFCRRTGKLIVDYDPASKSLKVPLIAGLPTLAARAATLCSGFLPAIERAPSSPPVLAFSNVPEYTARLIRASLT
jgi:hypothetical protein